MFFFSHNVFLTLAWRLSAALSHTSLSLDVFSLLHVAGLDYDLYDFFFFDRFLLLTEDTP